MKETTLQPLVIGNDFAYPFHIKNGAETLSLDITGWTLSFMVKRFASDPDVSALITKTTGAGTITIAGVFNATPTSNLQRATVTIADTDTDPLAQGVVYWELKRMDNALETTLGYGTVRLVQGAHRT